MGGTVRADPLTPYTHRHMHTYTYSRMHAKVYTREWTRHRHWVSLLCQSFFLSGHTVLGTGGGGPKASKEQSRIRGVGRNDP